MKVECPSLSRFASFHDSCVRRLESDPARFDPQLLEFAAARLRELLDRIRAMGIAVRTPCNEGEGLGD